MNPHLLDQVSGNPLFRDLPAERVPRAASIFCLRTYERGETIAGAADAEPFTYVIADGVARAVAVDGEGRCVTTGLLDSGHLFGVLPAVDDARHEQVEALDACTVLRASTSDLERLLAVDPIVARNAAGLIADRLQDATARLEGLAFQPVPARVAGVLIDLADRFGKVTPEGVRIDVRMTHGTLAELTGTTRETLTKVAGWMRSEEIATIERRVIWVHSWDALVEVAEGRRCMPGRTARVALAA
jgi:CRP-like cAMP-binding protein